MNLPGYTGAPIRRRWVLDLGVQVRRWQRLLRQPLHEIGHRYHVERLRDYRHAILREGGLPRPVRDRLEALPPGFLSVYSMHRETVAWLHHHTRDRAPRRCLETGCGISTVVTAMALEATFSGPGTAKLVSLESGDEWLAATQAVLDSFGLSAWVDLRLAPLVEAEWGGRTWRCYDPAVVADLSGIEQLLVDGPPSQYGRAPVLGLFHRALQPGARILLDDARREGERSAVTQWKALGLARLLGYAAVGNGLAILESR